MTTTEEPWQRSDLTKAIQRMKTQKAADECGLVAELLFFFFFFFFFAPF